MDGAQRTRALGRRWSGERSPARACAGIVPQGCWGRWGGSGAFPGRGRSDSEENRESQAQMHLWVHVDECGISRHSQAPGCAKPSGRAAEAQDGQVRVAPALARLQGPGTSRWSAASLAGRRPERPAEGPTNPEQRAPEEPQGRGRLDTNETEGDILVAGERDRRHRASRTRMLSGGESP